MTRSRTSGGTLLTTPPRRVADALPHLAPFVVGRRARCACAAPLRPPRRSSWSLRPRVGEGERRDQVLKEIGRRKMHPHCRCGRCRYNCFCISRPSRPLSVDALGDALDEELLRRPQRGSWPSIRRAGHRRATRPPAAPDAQPATRPDAPGRSGLARRSAPEEACKSLVSLVYHPRDCRRGAIRGSSSSMRLSLIRQ